jgi:hypothetical protein
MRVCFLHSTICIIITKDVSYACPSPIQHENVIDQFIQKIPVVTNNQQTTRIMQANNLPRAARVKTSRSLVGSSRMRKFGFFIRYQQQAATVFFHHHLIFLQTCYANDLGNMKALQHLRSCDCFAFGEWNKISYFTHTFQAIVDLL